MALWMDGWMDIPNDGIIHLKKRKTKKNVLLILSSSVKLKLFSTICEYDEIFDKVLQLRQ